MGMCGGNDMNTPVLTSQRNPMLANTEPTDEELHLVMREARDVARQRKLESEAWMIDQLNKAVLEAQERIGSHA
jgi:hypothetical protein